MFEGGGVKAVGLVGALSTLEDAGFVPQNLAGTSAGAIVATLSAAGYSAAEVRDELQALDFRDLLDRGWEDRLPLVGRPLSLLLDQGVYEGDRLLAWVAERLADRGVATFGDLVHPQYADDPAYRHRVQVIASDLTARRLLVLPRDARSLGIEPDELDVALAVRMSASLPFFFEPLRVRDPGSGLEHVVVDGGVLSNFPVWLFDVDGEPPWPTFGLLLVEQQPRRPLGDRVPASSPGDVRGLVGYVRALVGTMLEAHDRLHLERADFVRTIPIPTLGVGTTEFGLSRDRSDALYESGRAAAADFLAHWDFDAYVAEFRVSAPARGAPVGGRSRLRAPPPAPRP